MVTAPPRDVVWDITYACPLRCAHCYSESGRRPSRQLSGARLFRVADALVSLRPHAIVFAGGEPLSVPEIFDVARRVGRAGVQPHLYTGGWKLAPAAVPALMDVMARITVSLDGAIAATHDRIRGRVGSFERALAVLAQLDTAIGRRRQVGRAAPALGIDFVVVRSNHDELAGFCAHVASRFANLDSVFFGAVLPTGLASRPSFAEHELLDEGQAERLRDGSLRRELQRLAPAIEIRTSDNGMFQMHPDRLAAGEIPAMQVEPDGLVRAMPIYEGTVGSLLQEDPFVLWERAVSRWSDPWVTSLLRSASSPADWAEATRRIDARFGSDADRARIRERPPYHPPSGPGGA
ncbi:radical SAM protein [Nonomuraea sp. NPDC046802]|uniref:radical SAM protein n=1 Tax=Nonomuraea sp. NPDC046802 TaxID=3154919 RepID=UPI0033DBB6DA